MPGSKGLHMYTFILLAIGGILWGVDGLFNWQLGGLIGEQFARIVYIVVGASAVYELATHKSSCKVCAAKSETPSASMENGNPPMVS